MSTKLVLKNADFSENGIYNPTYNWFLDYSLGDRANNLCGAPLTSDIAAPVFTELAGKKVRFIWLKIYTSSSSVVYPKKVAVFNYVSTSNTHALIGRYDFTIESNSNESFMVIDLGQEIEFTDGLIISAYNSTLGDMSKAVIAGMTTNMPSSYVGYNKISYAKNVSFEGNNIKFSSSDVTTYASWGIDIKFGL